MNWRTLLPTLVGPLVLLGMLATAEVRYAGFDTAGVISGLWTSRAPLFLVSIGMTWVVIAGGIDLAVGAVATLSAFVTVWAAQAGVPPVLAVVCGPLVGLVAGATQGLAVHRLGLPAFIVTLAGMFLARGAALMLSPEPLSLPAGCFGGLPGWAWRLGGTESTVTSLCVLCVAACAVVWDFRGVGGRWVRALGDNPVVCSGRVPVARVRVATYVLSGALAGVAGIAALLYVPTASHDQSQGMELDAIASVVIGGTLMTGGRGSVLGTLVGVHVVGLALVLPVYEPGLSPGAVRMLVAAVLLAFVVAQIVLRRLAGSTGRGVVPA